MVIKRINSSVPSEPVSLLRAELFKPSANKCFDEWLWHFARQQNSASQRAFAQGSLSVMIRVDPDTREAMVVLA